ncbi:MAG: class IV adenylate cyclase [Isosphaeraceae bacterium]
MSFEIEQKFRTTSHSEVEKRLQRMGATAGPTIEQEDTYLNHPSRDFAQSHEAFRIRRVGESNAITYKGPKREGPTKTREEIEIAFAAGPENHEHLRKVLGALGFRPVAVIRKKRTSYTLSREGRQVLVVLDVAEGLGTFVEVETIANSEADFPEAQRLVLKIAESLGLSEIEPRSYLRMHLEKRGQGPGG